MRRIDSTLYTCSRTASPGVRACFASGSDVLPLPVPGVLDGAICANGLALVEVVLIAEAPMEIWAEAEAQTFADGISGATSDLDLYVLDRFGKCVAYDNRVGDTPTCGFTPIGSGAHLIKLVNNTPFPVTFTLYVQSAPECEPAMQSTDSWGERRIRSLRMEIAEQVSHTDRGARSRNRSRSQVQKERSISKRARQYDGIPVV